MVGGATTPATVLGVGFRFFLFLKNKIVLFFSFFPENYSSFSLE
jgi:hypothetical protein